MYCIVSLLNCRYLELVFFTEPEAAACAKDLEGHREGFNVQHTHRENRSECGGKDGDGLFRWFNVRLQSCTKPSIWKGDYLFISGCQISWLAMWLLVPQCWSILASHRWKFPALLGAWWHQAIYLNQWHHFFVKTFLKLTRTHPNKYLLDHDAAKTIKQKCCQDCRHCFQGLNELISFHCGLVTPYGQGWVSSGRNLFLPGHPEKSGRNLFLPVLSGQNWKKLEKTMKEVRNAGKK